MLISGSFSGYYSALTHTKKDLENQIEEKPQRFAYGSADYERFQASYSYDGYVKRKILAIPFALIAGICKTIYRLARIIFISIPMACAGEDKFLKAEIYRLARDMQEASGWIITLFNDKEGSYQVQESLFQKECYTYYENKRNSKQIPQAIPTKRNTLKLPIEEKSQVITPPAPIATTRFQDCFTSDKYKKPVDLSKKSDAFWYSAEVFYYGVAIPYYDEAKNITLHTFSEMNLEEQKAAIKKFKLERPIQEIGEEIFFQRLNETKKKYLDLVTLVDLKLSMSASNIKYALMSDDEFKTLTLNQLKEDAAESNTILSKRLKDLTVGSQQINFEGRDILDLPLIQFRNLSGTTINAFIEKIPASIFHLFTDQQIKEINFEKVSKEQIDKLFILDDKEELRRFALLSPTQVNAMLDKLDRLHLTFISDYQLMKLDLKHLSQERLGQLFFYVDGKEELRRFALLSPEQVNSILNRLDDYRLTFISDEQLVKLQLKKHSQKEINRLFCYIDEHEEKRRFALLSVNQVNSILVKLDDYRLSLISDAQLTQIDMSKLSKEQVHIIFPNWSKDAIRTQLNGKPRSFFSIFKNDSDQKKISEQEINAISEKRKNANMAKFKLLSQIQMDSIKVKLSRENQILLYSLQVVKK